jgi:hypothetical protein
VIGALLALSYSQEFQVTLATLGLELLAGSRGMLWALGLDWKGVVLAYDTTPAPVQGRAMRYNVPT